MKPTICLFPKLSGIGGMVSFQAKLIEGLSKRGINVSYSINESNPDSVLVIGGTKHIYQLLFAKRRGIPIVQRLDGMNWIHRVLNTGAAHWLKAEYGNFNLNLIRSKFADRIVYQSQFSKNWWDRVRGEVSHRNLIIHNGVDLSKFSPISQNGSKKNTIRLLIVEGSLLGGYEFGLENAVLLAYELDKKIDSYKNIELYIVGKVSVSLQQYWENWIRENVPNGSIKLKWSGVIAHQKINAVYQAADLFYSADINAACPNSVLESLASGTPVIAFDTGALSELLEDQGGIVVPYGGDPWKVDKPDIGDLAEQTKYLLDNIDRYRVSARKRAESAFGLDTMVDKYVDILLG
jgi:glycosyltransferase involved in cell wall biosynthesis